jgi:hypothetical protein
MATDSRGQTGRPTTRPSRRGPSASIGCLLLALIVGCNSKEPQVIDPRDLERIKPGEIVQLSGMLKKPAEGVCVLYPYQNAIDEKEPLARKANARLAEMKYESDEGHWAFVFIRGDNATAQRFSRGELDIASGHESLPRTFKAVDCATVSRAIVIKYRVYGRPTLILGVDR